MEGFNLLGWIMPFIVIAHRTRSHRVMDEALPQSPDRRCSRSTEALDERYRKRIEQEMADLD